MAREIWAIIGCDTEGTPLSEAATAGTDTTCDSTVAHIVDIQDASLLLPQNTKSTWISRNYTATGDDFVLGFWIYVSNPDMGVGASQDILNFSSDGGATTDFTLNHVGNHPVADSHTWLIKDKDGNVVSDAITEPITADHWHWVTISYERDSSGDLLLIIWNDWPIKTAATISNTNGQDFDGSGGGLSARVDWSGHIATPVAGGLAVRVGGMYIGNQNMFHQEFLSLRPTVNTTNTPDCDEDGLTASLDTLAAGTWEDTGDQAATFVSYAVGKGGGVRTAKQDLHSKVLADDYGIGKIIARITHPRAAGKWVYGVWNSGTNQYNDVAPVQTALGASQYYEQLVFVTDAPKLFPDLGTSTTIWDLPWVGFESTNNTCRMYEFSYLTMWPMGSAGEAEHISQFDHFTRGVNRGVVRGVGR